MAEKIENHIFIVTYGRTGSTVLQRVLNSIPGYFIRGENNHTLYPLYLAFRRAHEARYIHGANIVEEPWFGADEIDPFEFGRSLCQVFSDTVLRPPVGTRVLGFKEIRFHQASDDLFEPYLDFIAENFPGTRFIFNTRGWEAVSKSSWWATMKPENVRALVERCDSLFAGYATKHPDYCLQMRYEDFAGNPAAFEPMFDFLKEPYDKDAVEAQVSQKLIHAEVPIIGPVESKRNDLQE